MYEIKQHPSNCPPGHSTSIAHRGHGHWEGNSCCNASPTASISYIVPLLLCTAILLVIFSTKKLKTDKQRD